MFVDFLDIKIGATIANSKIRLVIINQKAPTVYKLWPIACTCKKLAKVVSADIGLKALNTISDVDILVAEAPKNNPFKLVNKFKIVEITVISLNVNSIIVKN